MDGRTTATAGPEVLQAAFEGIYQQHYRMVYRAAYRVLRNPQDAEDIQQRAFLRLIRSGLTPDRIANVKAYLYRTAVNEANCLLRYRGRREFADTNIEDVSDPLSELPDREARGNLVEAVRKLKPEAVQMLSLEEEGYPHAEIAQMLGKSQTLIRVTLFRARRRLKKLMENSARGTK